MSSFFRGILSKDGPQANLLGGLLLILTTCGLAITHIIVPVAEIVAIISIIGGMGVSLLGYTWTRTTGGKPNAPKP